METLNKAFNAYLEEKIDIADLKILVRKRIKELKKELLILNKKIDKTK